MRCQLAGMFSNSNWLRFSSYHPGGVQFCMGDGSLRMLAFGNTAVKMITDPPTPIIPPSDWFVLQAMAGAHDGQVVNTSSLAP
jgi:prepilin-type processing-associated H-X9-DG protein